MTSNNKYNLLVDRVSLLKQVTYCKPPCNQGRIGNTREQRERVLLCTFARYSLGLKVFPNLVAFVFGAKPVPKYPDPGLFRMLYAITNLPLLLLIHSAVCPVVGLRRYS